MCSSKYKPALQKHPLGPTSGQSGASEGEDSGATQQSTHSAAACKAARPPKGQRSCHSLLDAVAPMLDQRGVKRAFGLTCEAALPCASPEAVPRPAGAAPGVVAEASPQGGLPPRLHAHPGRGSSSSSQRIRSPSLCPFGRARGVSARGRLRVVGERGSGRSGERSPRLQPPPGPHHGARPSSAPPCYKQSRSPPRRVINNERGCACFWARRTSAFPTALHQPPA